MDNIFHSQSETHLGDCLLHAHFLNEVVKLHPNFIFNYYVLDKHKEQVKDFVEDNNKVTIKPYNEAPVNSFRGWVGQFGIPFIPFNLCELRLSSYIKLCNKLQIKCPFQVIEDLLPTIKKLNPTKEEWDILFINSTPLSNQLSKNIYDREFIEKFKNKKIITTKPIKDIPCTLDYNLSVYKIGQLSLFSKKIIGINTGPWFSVMNKNNLENKKTLYYLDENCKFTYSNCVNIDTLKIFI
jgi:hypothetical protein